MEKKKNRNENKNKNKIYFISIAIFFLLILIGRVNAQVYNSDGDFSVDIDTLRQTTSTSDVDVNFQVKLTNNLDVKQKFYINVYNKKGWTLVSDETDFTLDTNEEKIVDLRFKTDSDFDYDTSVVTPDIIRISQKENYVGSFEFPVQISGENQNVSLNFNLDIEAEEKPSQVYKAEIPLKSISPIMPLGFVIKADNLEAEETVSISLEIGEEKFEFADSFSPSNNYKIYQQNIPNTIEPALYDTKITIRLAKNDDSKVVWEWTEQKTLKVDEYKNLTSSKSVKKTFLKTIYTIDIANAGNIDEVYKNQVNHSFVKQLFFFTNNENYIKTGDGIEFNENLKKGDKITIEYEYNYASIYALLLIVLLFGCYIYINKKSNPLEVETKIHEVKTVTHEGIKSLKVRVGFENIKEQDIDKLSAILKVPAYLSVKDKSFLLTQPNRVLKGRKQYKLIWDFKKFEQNDSRIIGFTLVNPKGILGDIKLPQVEFEVTRKGKTKKYKKSFPIING